MASFLNQIRLSSSVLLEYDRLPPVEPYEEEYFDWEIDSVENGALNGEAVKLFSAHTSTLLLEYIISGHDSFSQFVELRDILYPDVDLLMYYNSILGYSDLPEWGCQIIDHLIRAKEVFPFSRSQSKIMVETESADDDDVVFAVKCDLTPPDIELIDSITFPALIECSSYRIALEKERDAFEEDVVYDVGIDEAIRYAFSIPDIVDNSLRMFSAKPVSEPYQIAVRNNLSNGIITIGVEPTKDSKHHRPYTIHPVICNDALRPERRFMLFKKTWPYFLIKE